MRLVATPLTSKTAIGPASTDTDIDVEANELGVSAHPYVRSNIPAGLSIGWRCMGEGSAASWKLEQNRTVRHHSGEHPNRGRTGPQPSRPAGNPPKLDRTRPDLAATRTQT